MRALGKGGERFVRPIEKGCYLFAYVIESLVGPFYLALSNKALEGVFRHITALTVKVNSDILLLTLE